MERERIRMMCRWTFFVALFSVALTALIRYALTPLLGSDVPLLLFVLPVIIVASRCGFWGGVYATLMGCAAGNFLFTDAVFGHLTFREIFRSGTFITASVLVTILCDRLAKTASKAQKAEREAVQNAVLMESLRAEAEEASEAKDRFIAALSHELRTPLTPVAATVSLLRNDPQVAADHRELLEIAYRNLEIEIKLIDDLLALSQITTGKMALRRVATSLHDAVKMAFRVLQPSAKAKDIKLTTDLSATNDTVICDPTRIDQVIWNLVGNAIKFTQYGGTIEIRTFDNAPDKLALEVEDNGLGIPEELRGRLFKPFEQGANATAKLGGLGLGLAISHTIVDAHGGTIEVGPCREGGGACFTVKLPVSDQKVVTNETVILPKAAPRAKAKLLLVEDHADTARLLSKVLRGKGYEVTIAGTVKDALKVLSEQTFDIMVSDIGLPDGTGLDVMAKMKSSGLRAIALSGYGTDEDKRKSAEAGFVSHMTKPISAQLLEETLEGILHEQAR